MGFDNKQEDYTVYSPDKKYNKIIIKTTKIKEKDLAEKLEKEFIFWIDKTKEKFLKISPSDYEGYRGNNEIPEIPMNSKDFIRIISTAISYEKHKNNPELVNKIYSHNRNKYIKTKIKEISHRN